MNFFLSTALLFFGPLWFRSSRHIRKYRQTPTSAKRAVHSAQGTAQLSGQASRFHIRTISYTQCTGDYKRSLTHASQTNASPSHHAKVLLYFYLTQFKYEKFAEFSKEIYIQRRAFKVERIQPTLERSPHTHIFLIFSGQTGLVSRDYSTFNIYFSVCSRGWPKQGSVFHECEEKIFFFCFRQIRTNKYYYPIYVLKGDLVGFEWLRGYERFVRNIYSSMIIFANIMLIKRIRKCIDFGED